MDASPAREKKISVEINELLWVELPDEHSPRTYRSRVEDLNDDRVIVAWPTDGGVKLPIREQQNLALSFVRRDAVYSFRAVVERRRQLPIPQLTLRPAGPAERIQRRQYFRVKASMQVDLVGSEGEPSGNVRHIRSRTHDVSGSGISVRHAGPIPVGTVFDTRLILPGEIPAVKAVSKVVQSTPVPAEKAVYHVGMHFLTITEADRSRIMRVLFRIQSGMC